MAALTTSLTLVCLLTACSPTASSSDHTPAPLTAAQAERLAVTRFHNFDEGTRAFTLTLPGPGGTITATGYADFADGLVYAAAARDDESLGLVEASEDSIAVREIPVDGPVIPLPQDAWQTAPFDPSSSPLTAAIGVLLSLGSDRPENPQLLQQSDAAWLRSDALEVDGEEISVDVFASPSPAGSTLSPLPAEDRSRYWVAADGTLVRFEARLGGADDWTVIDFSDADGVDIGDAMVGS